MLLPYTITALPDSSNTQLIYAPDKPKNLKKAALILSSGSGHVEDMGIFTAYDKQNKSEEKLCKLRNFGKTLE